MTKNSLSRDLRQKENQPEIEIEKEVVKEREVELGFNEINSSDILQNYKTQKIIFSFEREKDFCIFCNYNHNHNKNNSNENTQYHLSKFR